MNWSPQISPDGQRVVFSQQFGTKSNLYLIPVEGGTAEQLTFRDSYNAGASWSPDGNTLAFASTENNQQKVWTISASGGAPREYEGGDLSTRFFHITWAPGHEILYQRPGYRNFHFLDATTGDERAFLEDSTGWVHSPRYSPDGEQAAFYWLRSTPAGSNRAIWVYNIADATTRKLRDVERGMFPIQWSADGAWIYAFTSFQSDMKVIQISAVDGELKPFVSLPEGTGAVTISPDGKTVIATVYESFTDAWLMENFDPTRE